jgi:hypothetical protein
MEFGLLPKFSTPVQKPVENAGVLAFRTNFGRHLLHFLKAKARKQRFEAILGPLDPNFPIVAGQP